jgi:acyl-CoA reductase-like NAD-dependent aldehyde dehydrogenase
MIQSSVYDAFLDKLLEKTRALRVDKGMDEATTTVGPLTSLKAVEGVDAKVK